MMRKLVCGVLALLPAGVLGQPRFLDGEIKLSLIRPSDLSRQELSDRTAKISTSQVAVKPGDTVKKLLQSNGIYANGDAFALTFALNPGVSKLDSSGIILTLPKVTGAAALKQALNSGQLVVLSTNDKVKTDLRSTVTGLRDLISAASGLAGNRFEGEQRDEAVRLLESIQGNLELVRKMILNGMVPLSRETLVQIYQQADLLRLMLSTFTASGDILLSTADQETIKAIAEDLQIKAGGFEEIRGGEIQSDPSVVHVVVQARKQQDGSPVANLRVYYVVEALYSKAATNNEVADQFRKVTSPADQDLPVANYRIWAGRAGEPTPVTDVPKVKVRKEAGSNDIQVDLQVIR